MEMLLKKEIGTAKPILGQMLYKIPLATGPESLRLEGRKMAMANTHGIFIRLKHYR
jgi:hypothetical protein